MFKLPRINKKRKTYRFQPSVERRHWKTRRFHKRLISFIGAIPRTLFRRKPFRIIIIFFMICLVIIGARYFFFSPKFMIDNIEFVGNSNLSTQYLRDNINSVLRQNIFLVRSSRIQNELKNLSPYIKDVQVEKVLPNKVMITVVEREPYMIWINFSGAYFLDTEGLVLEIAYDFKDLTLSEEDIDLLKGYGNIKEITKKEEELQKKKEIQSEKETGKESTMEEISTEDSIALLESQQQEVISRVDNFWRAGVSKMDKRYRKYPFVYSYESKKYTEEDLLDPTIMSNTKLGVDISYLKKDIVRYIWESQFRFVILLTEGRKIVFSTRRDFLDQVEDLKILITELRKENRTFSFIDLGSKVIPVE